LWFGSDAEPLNTLKDWARFQDHAFASAERTVIDGAVTIMREGPQVMGDDPNGSRIDREAEYRVFERTGKEAGEYGQNVELHGN